MFYAAFTMKDVGTRSFCALVWHALLSSPVVWPHSIPANQVIQTVKNWAVNTWKEECFVYWANQMSTESFNVKLNF